MDASPLSPLGKKKKTSNTKQIVVKTLKALLALFFLVALSIGAQVSYMYGRYQPFFISGESMWPTLNYDSRYMKGDGVSTSIDPSSGDYRSPGQYLCDYGLMDSSDGFIDRLERFDIVVATSRNGDSLVIKRLMAFPGESFYFSEEEDDLGSFYVKKPGEDDYTLIEQPFYDPSIHPEWSEEDIALVEEAKGRGTIYRAPNEKFENLGGEQYCLGPGEFFLCGDNRAHSGDSRSSRGPFKEDELVGRAIAIIGKATYVIPVNGTPSYHVELGNYLAPWAFRWLVD